MQGEKLTSDGEVPVAETFGLPGIFQPSCLLAGTDPFELIRDDCWRGVGLLIIPT